MKKKDENIISPHTIKKFELIESYVEAWARKILGYNKSKGLIYIDCMCNRGLYQDKQGNLVEGTSIRVVKKLSAMSEDYPGKQIFIYFNDIDSQKIKDLQNFISSMNIKNVRIEFRNEDFRDFLHSFHLSQYSNYNSLLFYDPYQANIDWESIQPFLNTWGEVIINHMVSDTIRGIEHVQNNGKIKKYETTYERTIEELVKGNFSKEKLEKIIEELILKHSNNQREKFIAVAPFYTRTNSQIYSIIHYSTHIEGFKLFKKCVWKSFNGNSSMKRNNDIVGQLTLFDNEINEDFIGDTDFNNVYNYDDMARYIYSKYAKEKEVSLDTIYNDLSYHPIFPSDGMKNEFKNAMKRIYSNKINIKQSSIEFRGFKQNE